MNVRPTSITVLSIIGLVLGGLGVLGVIWGLVAGFVHFGPPNPALDALNAEPGFTAYRIISGVVGLLTLLLLIAGCIGSLGLRPSARIAMLAIAWIYIVEKIIETLIAVLWLVPKMVAVMPIPAGSPPGMTSIMSAVMYGSAIVGALLAFIYPVFVIIFYNRLKVVNAFKGIFEPSPRDFPLSYAEEITPPRY